MMLVSSTLIKNDAVDNLFLELSQKYEKLGKYNFPTLKRALVKFLNKQNNKLLWSVMNPLHASEWTTDSVNELLNCIE